ncbi:MAG: SUMF1/EgtB/PvdO family nonheme iron enzyme, partial [Candidatus Poribacteria bacterium]
NFADKNVDQYLRDSDPSYDWADLNVDDGYQFSASVGSYPANGYGLHDMAGNVSEWCQSWYDRDKIRRVLRGGSWNLNTNLLRAAYRDDVTPSSTNDSYGFRCVSGFLVAQQ